MRDYCLVNVNIISMNGEEVIEQARVRIEKGRIASISTADQGPSARTGYESCSRAVDKSDSTADYSNGYLSDSSNGYSADYKADQGVLTVDCRGGYLIPALSDMHIHMELTDECGNYVQPALFREKENSGIDFTEYLKLYLANGVTLVRNMSGHPGVLAIKKGVARGEITGPRIVTAAPLTDGYPPVWGNSQVVRTREQAREAVLRAEEEGYDFFKIYNFISLECFEEILKTAGEIGMPVSGHIPRAVGPDRVIASPMSSVEHVKAFPLTHLEKAATAGKWMVPTLIVQYATDLLADEGRSDSYLEEYSRDFVSRDLKKIWIKLQHFFKDYDFKLDRTYEEYRRSCKRYLDLGGRLLCGTDALLPFVVPGFSLHEELEQLAAGGLTPFQALKTATCNPAEYLNELDQAGTVEVGKKAELVLLEENPLRDIRNTRKIKGLCYQGEWLDRQDLDKLLQDVKEVSALSYQQKRDGGRI